MKGAHLSFPFGTAPLLLVGVFTLGFLIAGKAGFPGLWLAVLLVSWFFKYCFVMLDAIVAGAEEPPVLSIEMVNPVSEQRPLAAGMLIAAGAWLVWAAHARFGNALSVPLSMVLLAVLPAVIVALAVTGNPLRAAWPGMWGACIRGMGRDYWLTCLAMLIAGTCVYGLWSIGAPSWVNLASTQLLFLLVVAFIGGAVHEHRNDLGIDTLTRAERMAARDEQHFVTERKQMLDRTYGLLRVGRTQDAWKEVDAWFENHAARGENIAEYKRVFDASLEWRDARIGDKLAEDLIGLLLARRDNGNALEVCERWLAANPQFQPRQATRLAELASLAGKRALGRRLRIGRMA